MPCEAYRRTAQQNGFLNNPRELEIALAKHASYQGWCAPHFLVGFR